MPNSKCFVPGCKSGYKSNNERVSLFRAPKDAELLKKWESAIPRADRQLHANDVVCAKHFFDSDIITVRKIFHDGKEVLSYFRWTIPCPCPS